MAPSISHFGHRDPELHDEIVGVTRTSVQGRLRSGCTLMYNDQVMIDLRDLLQEAMKLPREARAALAGSLLESLDNQVDAETAWCEELERRICEVDKGTAR